MLEQHPQYSIMSPKAFPFGRLVPAASDQTGSASSDDGRSGVRSGFDRGVPDHHGAGDRVESG